MSSPIIDATTPYTQSIASNLQTQFDTDWTADSASEVLVYERAQATPPNDVTQLVSSADYNVTFVGAQNIVRVTFLVGRTAGDVITITRDTPADRMNLYTNTNFTPSMLNGDFERIILMIQQSNLYNLQLTPHYNLSAEIQNNIDNILPLLPEQTTWVKNKAGTAIIAAPFPEDGAADRLDTFVTILDNTADIPNSYPLINLATGILINYPGTGLIVRSITGTTYQIDIVNGDGFSGDINVAIHDNVILPGTAGMGIPQGTTGQRVTPSQGIALRYNTSLAQIEYYASGGWIAVADADDIAALLARLASHSVGEGASLIGLEDQGSVSGKTVQSLANLDIVTLTDETGTLVNGKVLGTYALLLTGGTMTGALDMGGELIHNVPNPVAPGDAANKAYVDSLSPVGVYLPLAGGTMSGVIDMGSNKITNVTDPTTPQGAATKAYADTKLSLSGGTMTGFLTLNADPSTNLEAATKQYVDNISENIQIACIVATTANLAGYTYNNGAAGIGATLTAGSNGAFSADGVSPPINSRILVPFQSTQYQNGIYTLTTVGDGSNPAVLTRATDYDQTYQIQAGDRVSVVQGTSYAGAIWMMTQVAAVTVGVTAITWILSASVTGVLLAANNLSDVQSVSTSRTNLGLGTGNTPTFVNVELTGTTTHDVLVGNSSGPITSVALAANNVLIGVSAADPTGSTLSDLMDTVFGNTQGDVLYRNASGWVVLAPGTSGYALVTGGAAANPAWAAIAGSSTVAITDDTTTNATMYPTWVTTTTGNLPLKVSSTKITFNPSTATLTTTNFAGTATNATNVATTATNSTNATFYPTFVASATSSNQGIDTATGLTWNPSTATLTATNFAGIANSVVHALTAGSNITFSSGTTYNGSAAITINATGSLSSPLTTKGDIWGYTTTNARLAVGSTNGQVLQVSSGASTGLAYSTPTYPSASGSAGLILRSDGTNNVYTTSTFADTYAASTLLYSNGANTVTGLATANSAALVTSSTGVPAWSSTMTNGQVIIGSTGATPVAASIGAGSGLTTQAGAGTFSISLTAAVIKSYISVASGSQSMTTNTGYQANNGTLCTLTLPSTAQRGDILAVNGYGAGGWKIAQNASGQIIYGNLASTSGTGGYVASTNQYDSVILRCMVANNIWTIESSQTAGLTVV